MRLYVQALKYTYAKENLLHLQELFGEESRTARYEISKRLFCAKIKECEDVAVQENSMIRAIEKLDSLDFSTDFHLQLDWILLSLPKSFGQIITNFHMNKSEGMLRRFCVCLRRPKRLSKA